MKSDYIYLDQEGYNEFLKEINTLEEEKARKAKEVLDIIKEMSEEEANQELEEAKIWRHKIEQEINYRKNKLSIIRIIERTLGTEDIIDINDYVTIKMILNENDYEIFTVKLITNGIPTFDKEIKEITTDSPLGKSIYQKKIGEKTSYTVNNKQINVEILSKSKTKENILKLTQK